MNVAANSITPRQLAHGLPLRAVLRDLGWHFRSRCRADCGLCQGHTRGTVAFDDGRGVWHCHRCKAGGDVFSLVKLATKCSFPEAMDYIANLAGLPAARARDKSSFAALTKERAARRAVEAAAEGLAQRARELRLQCSDELHRLQRNIRVAEAGLDALGMAAAGDSEWWTSLAASTDALRRCVSAHALLSFAAVAERVSFIRADAATREAMIARVLNSGFVRREDGGVMEVSL